MPDTAESDVFVRDVLAISARVDALAESTLHTIAIRAERAEHQRDIYRDALFAALDLLNRACILIGQQQQTLSDRHGRH